MTDRRLPTHCAWCGVPIRGVTVLEGYDPGIPRRRWLSTEPDPTGQVIERADGSFRMLAPGHREATGLVTFRVHNRRDCDPNVTDDYQPVHPAHA